ncbi:MAG: aminodeoxychorismate synthase component I [Armatimonadetes bacterium]|nr:aminodeoxychorismate synthase component I [Armatimonadota bacterium]
MQLVTEELFLGLRQHPYVFFLDGEGNFESGRFSFLGARPFIVFRSTGDQYEYAGEKQGSGKGDPFRVLESLWRNYGACPGGNGGAFSGGLVGYISYDAGRLLEKIPNLGREPSGVPDLFFGFYRDLYVFDHRNGKLLTLGNPPERRFASLKPLSPGARPLESDFTRKGYCDAVRKAQEYIACGDIYQVNLSQRFQLPFREDPASLYLRLRRLTPAPFSAYLDCGDFQVLSTSPERFLKLEARSAETCPIKGTRPRSEDPVEDERLAQELLSSIKDRAEHLMIVDLERNDLGRVCRYGSVHVEEFEELHRFPQVSHLISTVKGDLRENISPFDLIRATFPGGSITGAPKIRSMEIIEELEPVRRGVYTGAIGYIGFQDTLDLNIAIRTMIVQKDLAHFHVGGGIVADSDPEAEYQETLDKARGIMMALKA